MYVGLDEGCDVVSGVGLDAGAASGDVAAAVSSSAGLLSS